MTKVMTAAFLIVAISCFAYGTSPEYLYVAGTNVRLRTSPDLSGAVVTILPAGSWCKVLERSASSQNIAGKLDHWYKISAESHRGWIFGGLTFPASLEERFSKAYELGILFLDRKPENLEDCIQICKFVHDIKSLAEDPLDKAHLEFLFLQVLDRICTGLSLNRNVDRSVISDFAADGLVYYHESAGQCFVKPSEYWRLAAEYRELPEVADEIAWAAARQTLEGETEGDPEMMMNFFSLSYFAYIEKYPDGKHLEEALAIGSEILGFISTNITSEYFGSGDAAMESMKAFCSTVDKMRRIVLSRRESSARGTILKEFDAIIEKLN